MSRLSGAHGGAESWTGSGRHRTLDVQREWGPTSTQHRVSDPRVHACHPQYASDVLSADRHVACLRPCSIAVWEADDGKVHVTKMNTGLMGKTFGGNIAAVMGNKVARDEAAILEAVLGGEESGP